MKDLVGVVGGRIQWSRSALLFGALIVQQVSSYILNDLYLVLAQGSSANTSALVSEAAPVLWTELVWHALGLTCLAAIAFRWFRLVTAAIVSIALGEVVLLRPVSYWLMAMLVGVDRRDTFASQYWDVASVLTSFLSVVVVFGAIAIALQTLSRRRRAVVAGAAMGGALTGVLFAANLWLGAPGDLEIRPGDVLRLSVIWTLSNCAFGLILMCALPSAAGDSALGDKPEASDHRQFESDKQMDFFEWAFLPYLRYAQFKGRARRKEFWAFNLLLTIPFVGLMILDLVVSRRDSVVRSEIVEWKDGGFIALFGFWILVSLVPAVAVSVRRLHDRGFSGWLFLISFVPFLGLAGMLAFTLLDGTVGPNRFGPDPRGRRLSLPAADPANSHTGGTERTFV
jgi:uncharacterized membrane protein YhaH (DUF805 family)